MKWKKFARGFHNKFQEAPNNLRICVMSQIIYFFVSFLSWSQQFLNSIIMFFELHLAATIPKTSKLDSALQYCDVKPAIEKEFP